MTLNILQWRQQHLCNDLFLGQPVYFISTRKVTNSGF